MDKPVQTPISRTARLLDLVPYLATHQGIELIALANVFGVTQSQMIADLTTLWMCGLPGYTPLELMDLSFESGFVTINNAETLSSPRTLNDEESIALLLGLDLVIESLPQDRQDLKRLALALVKRLSLRTNVRAKLAAIPAVAGSTIAVIESALSKKQYLGMTYHSLYSDTISKRVVLPLELRSEGGVEYLFGICQSASSTRMFRLDRIQALELVSIPVEPVLEIQIDDTIKTSYRIRVHSRPRDAAERFALDSASVLTDPEISSFSNEWVRRSVLASSGTIELLDPPNLRREVATAAKSILTIYQRQ